MSSGGPGWSKDGEKGMGLTVGQAMPRKRKVCQVSGCAGNGSSDLHVADDRPLNSVIDARSKVKRRRKINVA